MGLGPPRLGQRVRDRGRTRYVSGDDGSRGPGVPGSSREEDQPGYPAVTTATVLPGGTRVTRGRRSGSRVTGSSDDGYCFTLTTAGP